MSLSIKKTTNDLWIARGEITYFASRLEQAGMREEFEALAKAGIEVGRALLRLEDLLAENDGAIKAALETLEASVDGKAQGGAS